VKIAVIRFPGSNCDQDAFHALRDQVGVKADYVWHEDRDLSGFDGVFLPGGFSYGDYLRCGAIASRAPIMDEVSRMAAEGRPVLGVCNGFQVLCEAGLLPGALLANQEQKFLCKYVHLEAVNRTSMWTAAINQILRIPIAHGEGRYTCDRDTLRRLQDEDRIAFRYVGPNGDDGPEHNVNGSVDRIAGVLNEGGNVLGMMPHPERAVTELSGSSDGLYLLKALTLARV
jgi:phosphoribosylformylglycinamidine synthase subunit PurQ / glutaminase